MACTFPFNVIKKGAAGTTFANATQIVGPEDFIYGTGTINLKGDDSAVTTADGLIHNYRNAITPDAQADVRGDKRSLDTAAPDSNDNVWPALGDTLFLGYQATRGGTVTEIASFQGIISVEFDTKENKSTLSITGCSANY